MMLFEYILPCGRVLNLYISNANEHTDVNDLELNFQCNVLSIEQTLAWMTSIIP